MASSVCDSCKRRKVKCDLSDPCSNCRISQLHCQYTAVPSKRGRKRRPPRNQDRDTQIEPAGLGDIGISQREAPRTPSVRELQLPSFPRTLRVIPEPPFTVPVSFSSEPEGVFSNLVADVAAIAPNDEIAAIVHRCLDLFVQYLFPTCPIIHESTFRSLAALYFTRGHSTPGSSVSLQPPELTETIHKKEFALITGLCAAVASVMPEFLMPHQHLLTQSFLNASRIMLRMYCDYDLEYPDSSSLLIRLWHSAALQNSTGKAGAAWHALGEATLLAQKLRLYEESSLSRFSPIESQTLRATFWQLFAADKSAAAFEDRPIVLHPLVFYGDLTLQDIGNQNIPLLDVRQDHCQFGFEDRLLAGFRLKCRVWSLGGDLIQQIKLYSRQKTDGLDAKVELARLTETYLRFTGLIDDLPQWLQSFEADPNASETDTFAYQRSSFWVQRSNILTSYHCLELLVLQRCIKYGTLEDMGLSSQLLSVSTRKLEIVRDFVRELHMAPFVCLKVQGEASVERIRHIGSAVLEITETVDDNNVKERANVLFKKLLDFLARLNSKASDELASSQPHPAIR
ncbi:hypothetical protein ALT_1012 [Aspergillus lentulus]|uniref:Zn(2)-C6 fungal-type domain-containing protein n=1 Tax=Aspergillus lentulus TaxID=293939 RepID=A0AAN4T763_ASPLE|nr:hypothetical protein ALT_1012 [Aspergillus lentulus]